MRRRTKRGKKVVERATSLLAPTASCGEVLRILSINKHKRRTYVEDNLANFGRVANERVLGARLHKIGTLPFYLRPFCDYLDYSKNIVSVHVKVSLNYAQKGNMG